MEAWKNLISAVSNWHKEMLTTAKHKRKSPQTEESSFLGKAT